jgi:mono/diheme cytochrome c family protein
MKKQLISKMNRYLNILVIACCVIFVASAMSSCSSDPDSAGKEYMPDMYRSPAIETYVDYGEVRGREDKEAKIKLSARQTPKYTIPFVGTDLDHVNMMMPNKVKAGMAWRESHGLYGWDLDTESGYEKAGMDSINPYTMNAKNAKNILEEGKKLYTSMCSHCHGEKGDGNGPMIKSGAYGTAGVVPAYDGLSALSNGQLFHSIYYGKGYMGAHGSILDKKEIWTLVHYVRQFQFEDYGKFDGDGQEDSNESEPVEEEKMK